MRPSERLLTQYDWCPYRRGRDSENTHTHTRREGHVRTQQEDGHLQATREASGESTLQTP